MMKQLATIPILFVLNIILAMPMKGQESQLTLEDLIPGGKNFKKYTPQMPFRLSWYEDKLTSQKANSIVFCQDSTKLITVDEINTMLDADEKIRNAATLIIANDKTSILVRTQNNIFQYNLTNREKLAQFQLLQKMKNEDFALSSSHLAYTQDNNLYIQNKEGVETSITEEENPRIVSGQAVHQNEFGIEKGTFWSPAENKLAFYQMDESMVSVYPIANSATRITSLKERIYPMAGMKSHHVKVGVYDLQTKETVFLKTETPKEKYLTNIAWSPDESTIYIAELNRGQDTCVVNSYNAKTGSKITTLFAETHPKYVEPLNPILFLKNNSTQFVWQSRRDGYNHLYLYNTDGKLLKQLTKGEFEITSVLGFDKKGDNIVYISTEESPIEQHIYKLDLKKGKKAKLSNEEGVHNAQISKSGKYLYDWYNSKNNPGKVSIIDIETNKATIVHEAKNPYQNITIPEIELGKIKTKDGQTDLYYRLTKPTNFDSTKKYPVVIYVYGGPHSQLVDNSWMAQARGWDIYMAQKGYIVFTLDNRGTQNRGSEFENITHRQLGLVETEDQMAGVEFLKSQPYVDHNKIGVHGWSYGGFLTLNLMLRYPDTFKVGVAGGPVTDWKYYEIMYGERYMDSPKENHEGYKETSMINRIENLKGRLLLIHGDQDPVVVMQHTSQLVEAAVRKRVHPDMFIYPGHEHNIMGRDRVHLYEHITRYFDDFLK